MAVGGYIYSHNSKIRTGLNSGLFNGLETTSQALFYILISYFILLNNNAFVKSRKHTFFVIPAKAGHVVTRSEAKALTISAIQYFQVVADHLDSGFHRSDDFLRNHQ